MKILTVKVFMRSGNSFEFECEDFQWESVSTGEAVKISQWQVKSSNLPRPQFIDPTQIEAVLVMSVREEESKPSDDLEAAKAEGVRELATALVEDLKNLGH